MFFPQTIFRARIKACLQEKPLRIIFQDEGRFGRISIPRSCWAPKGFRPTCGKQIIREYTYAYIGISPSDGTCDSLVLPNMYTPTMSLFLEEVSKRHSEEYILMILDGAPCHKPQELEVPKNMMIAHIPPYKSSAEPLREYV